MSRNSQDFFCYERAPSIFYTRAARPCGKCERGADEDYAAAFTVMNSLVVGLKLLGRSGCLGESKVSHTGSLG
jgi:hypothetical protein